MITPPWDGDEDVFEIGGALPSAEELRVVAHRRRPIAVHALPRGTVDLEFLRPIAGLITDLRIYSATAERVDVIADMPALQHLLIDDELPVPPINVRRLVVLRTYEGPLSAVPNVLRLPDLMELGVVTRPAERLQIDSLALRELRVAHTPRAESFAGVGVNRGLTTLGLNDIRHLEAPDLPDLPHLQRLHLARIGTLHDVIALQRFSTLELLTLTDVREVDVHALGELDCRVELLRTLPRAVRAELKPPPNVTVLE